MALLKETVKWRIAMVGLLSTVEAVIDSGVARQVGSPHKKRQNKTKAAFTAEGDQVYHDLLTNCSS